MDSRLKPLIAATTGPIMIYDSVSKVWTDPVFEFAMNRLRTWNFLMLITFYLTACTRSSVYPHVTFADLENRSPFKATVEAIVIHDFGLKDGPEPAAFIGLKTEAGDKMGLSETRGAKQVVGFARTLKKGAPYEFPKVWLEYKARTKT
jgi:hypothetical protein